jgi:MscS family membrane protein
MWNISHYRRGEMTDRLTQQGIPTSDPPMLGRKSSFLSEQSVTYLRFSISLLPLVLLFCVAGWSQLAVPNANKAAAKPDVPKDVLGRATPRGTVLGFLAAARKGDYETAALYLNTRLRDKAAAVLARQLFVILDRRLPARLNELSDNPQGSLADPIRPNEDLVGTISSANGDVGVLVERVDRKEAEPIWLFSSKTLESVSGLYEEVNLISAEKVNLVSVEKVLPGFLINTRLAGIQLFEWFAVFVGMPLLYLAGVLLSRVLSPPVGLLRRRLYRKVDLPNPEFLPTPVRLLLLAAAIRWLLSKINLPLLARQFWSSTATVITIAAIVWMLILSASWGGQYIRQRLRSRNLTGAASMLRLASWGINLLIIFAGVLVTLRYFAVDPTAALAGLGVGGIAVALAAQKTLENIIGGASLIFDQAVRVGDALKVGDTMGTVDDIGLRSIRIRTLDRTVVSVPNGQIANMSLENFSSRDKFWFHHVFGLRHETTSAQMRSVIDGIRTLLVGHSRVDHDSVRVRFLRVSSFSLDVDVFAYFFARDWSHFLEIQEELLFCLLKIVQQAGALIALPSQTMYMAANSATNGAGLTQASAPDSKPEPGLGKTSKQPKTF